MKHRRVHAAPTAAAKAGFSTTTAYRLEGDPLGLAQRGLRHVRSWLISCDGEATPVADFATDRTSNIVGWITVWRR